MPEINDWEEVKPINDWVEVPTGGKTDNSYLSVSSPEALRIGIGKGMVDIGRGAAERGLEWGGALGLPTQNILEQLKAKIAEERRLYQPLQKEHPYASGAGEMIGQMAPTMLIPGGAGETLLARILGGMGGGAAMGALQPTAKGESSLINTAIGATGGAIMPVALSPFGKAYNAFMGKVPANAIDQASEKYGIRTTLGEATNNPLWKKTETLLESVPGIGLKGFREKQQAEAQKAVTDHFAQYIINPSEITTAAMKESNDNFINGMYNSVKAQTKNLPKVEAPEIKQTTSELLDRYPKVFESIQDTKIKRILNDISGDVSDKQVKNILLNARGQQTTKTVTPTFSFDDLWELRKGLGQEIGSTNNDIAKGVLKQLYSAATNDVETSLSQAKTPALKAFRNANESFKQYSVKFDVLRQAYDKASGTTGAGEMFSPKIYSTALKNLANDPNYKKNVHWSAGEIEEMTGLANILQVTKRAGQYAENPPTGNRWGLPVIAAEGLGYLAKGTAGGVATAGAMVGGTGLASFLTQTAFGKNLARAASKIEPNSPQMQKIIDTAYQMASKAPAIAQGIRNKPSVEIISFKMNPEQPKEKKPLSSFEANE